MLEHFHTYDSSSFYNWSCILIQVRLAISWTCVSDFDLEPRWCTAAPLTTSIYCINGDWKPRPIIHFNIKMVYRRNSNAILTFLQRIRVDNLVKKICDYAINFNINISTYIYATKYYQYKFNFFCERVDKSTKETL